MVTYYNSTTKNGSLIWSKIFTFFIVLLPILRQYQSMLPGVNLVDILLGVSCVALLMSKNFNLRINKAKPILMFWFFSIFISLISFLVQQDLNFQIVSRMIRYSYYMFLIIVSAEYFQLDYALQILRPVTNLVAIYIVIQSIAYKMFSIVLPIRILPFTFTRDISLETLGINASKYYFRPYGLFLEPGYAAQFLFIGLVFSLFGWLTNEKIDYKSATLIFTALILTTSTQGIIVGIAIIGVYSIIIFQGSRNYNKLLKNIIIFIAIFIAIFIIILVLLATSNLEIVQRALDRVTLDPRPGGSVALRLFRGFAVFGEIPMIYKLIGVGHGGLGNLVYKYSILTKYDPVVMTPNVADYVNGISRVFLYYGIIALIFLFNIYWKIFKNTKNPFRLIAIIHFVLSFGSGIGIGDITSVFYFSFIFTGYNLYHVNKVK